MKCLWAKRVSADSCYGFSTAQVASQSLVCLTWNNIPPLFHLSFKIQLKCHPLKTSFPIPILRGFPIHNARSSMSSLMPLFSIYEKVALHVILIPPPSPYLCPEAKHIQDTVSARCTRQKSSGDLKTKHNRKTSWG